MKKSVSLAKAKAPVKTKRTRARITAAMRKKTVSLLKAGKTAAVVAKDVGISVASVSVIKKAAGLTKPRKKRAAAKKAARK